MKYAHYNKVGSIIGYYDSDKTAKNVPTPNIQLSDDDWRDCINNGGLRRVDLSTFQIVEYDPAVNISILDIVNTKPQKIADDCNKALSVVINKYPPLERETWGIQRAEVLAWQESPAATTPFIDALAVARGVTRDEQMTRVLAKVNEYQIVAAAAIGKRQRLTDLVIKIAANKALNTTDKRKALNAVKWSMEGVKESVLKS